MGKTATDGPTVYGATTPLLTTSNGQKMGKSVTKQGKSTAIWLDEELLSVFDYWQYWRNCDDHDVFKFLRLFTDIPVMDIDTMQYNLVSDKAVDNNNNNNNNIFNNL